MGLSERGTTLTRAYLARVISEDKDFVLLEVPKHDNIKLTVEEQDKFYTVVFVKHDAETHSTSAWEPFT